MNKELYPKVICTDGTTLSVQASAYHYSTPRNDYGPYTNVEVGFPSIAPTGKLLDYCEDPDKPTEAVYPYVPLDVVEEFIHEHGGAQATTLWWKFDNGTETWQ
jgi:hypothetical protein